MTILTRKVAFAGLASAGVLALLAGCAQAPAESGNGAEEETLDFTPCMVSDAGGFDDKSFNQLGYEGLTEAAEDLGVEPITVESAAETDYSANMTNLVDQGCNLIVSAGYLLEAATAETAEANPDVDLTIIDSFIDLDDDGVQDEGFDNVKPILYDTVQAAFMAGYAAASYSKTGVVGTYGGIPIPSVTIFMDGFVQGVNYHNEQKGTDVKALGWDVDSQNGSFTGGFAAGTESLNLAKGLIDQNADVLLPVGGPIFQSAVEAIADSGKEIAMIGVDADLAANPDIAGNELFLTSVLKDIKVGIGNVVRESADDKFDATPFVGTLENDGVGIAPFADFESKVAPDLQAELDEIKAGIIDGSIEVTSPSSPKS